MTLLCVSAGISGAVAKIVTPFIDYVINGIIVNMMVWPQRLVVSLHAVLSLSFFIAVYSFNQNQSCCFLSYVP